MKEDGKKMKFTYEEYQKYKKELRKELQYADWFGEGNTVDDIETHIKKRKPKSIWISSYMALIDFGTDFVVTGYDGNEYCHTFEFKKEERI